MSCRRSHLVVSMILGFAFCITGQLEAGTIVDMLGDEDFFGFAGGGTIGVDNIPQIDTDNRSPSDPLFTDHDVRDVVRGDDSLNNIDWTHDLSGGLTGAPPIGSVVVELALAGIQDGDSSFPGLDDRLYFEGMEVIGAFDSTNQGAFGTGLFSFSLTSAQINSFASDGVLDIFFDGGRVPSGPSADALESYYIDFSRVTVSVVPEPSSIALLGTSALSLIGFGLCRKKKRQIA